MSGGNKRRPSKWDNKDSEDFYDRASSRRPREPFSPVRGSRQNDSRSRENTMTLDREGNCTRISPELDDWRPQHSSQSPRNGWGRSQRISRSRSRSESPGHNFRRETGVNDRSRNRSGASGKICRDFAAGRCRRGHSCHFLHQDAQLCDSRQPLECGPPDDWEGRRRRTGSSRYSPDDIKDNAIRAEKSAHVCNDFLKGRCRRGDTCRFVHHDSSADVFEKVPGEEVYRNKDHERRSRDVRNRSRDTYPDDHDHRRRDTYPDHDLRSKDIYSDHDHRSRDTYPDHDHRSRDRYSDHDHRRKDMYSDRNHESEPRRSGGIPCKYFASGNCRNGTRCRFSHQVQEVFSPERRSRDDKRDADRNFEGSHGWDGPGWDDVTTVSAIPTVPGWEEDKSKNKNEGDQVWNGPSSERRSGTRARFSHQVQEEFSPKRRSRDDKRDTDCKFEGSHGWDGPGWGDVTTVSAIPTVPGWEEDKSKNKNEGDQVWNGPSWTDAVSMPIVQEVSGWGDDNNEIKEVAKDVTRARPMDDSLSHDMLIKPIWDPPATSCDKSQIQEKDDPLQWKTETNIPILSLSAPIGEYLSSGDMESSPVDIKQQPMFSSSSAQTLSSSNIAFVAVQQGIAGETSSFEKHYHTDLFGEQNPSYNKPISYSGEKRDVVGDHDGSSILQNQAITGPRGQIIFHSDKNANVNPIANITPPSQIQTSVLSLAPQGEGMSEVSYNPLSLENKVVAAPTPGSANSTVSNEQLAQLSHLTASLTQLLESRQQLSQLSSSVSPHGMSNLADLELLETPLPPVSNATVQLNQVPEELKQYDPPSSSIEQKIDINEIHEGYNSIPQEHLKPLKDEENGKDTAGLKAAENGPSQNVGSEDGADDSRKLIDIKEIRPFKFALAELVKELLKPSWKDGQVSKDAYKMIVKKVVDKVMETLGPHVPQTKEKIDMYLSCSKPKIDKLVQAYVAKHQKG